MALVLHPAFCCCGVSSLPDRESLRGLCRPAVRDRGVDKLGYAERLGLVGAPVGVAQPDQLLCDLFRDGGGAGEASSGHPGICAGAPPFPDPFGLGDPVLIPSQWILAALGLSFRVRHTLLLTGLGIILFLLLCLESPRLTAFFKSKPLLLLGKLSFSLYLTHTTLIVLFVTLLGQIILPEMALLLSPLFALPVAYLWQKHVETRCLDLLKHFKK